MTRYLLMVGWPKCGTSSIFTWLAHHPSISAATPKEAFFLMDEIHPLCGRHGAALCRDGIATYERFFSDTSETAWRLEATTHYVFQRTALEFARSLGPDVHVIFAMRDPVKRLRSSFEYTQNNLAEMSQELSFETYAEILLAGEGQRLTPHFSNPNNLWILQRELEYGQYLSWIAPWRDALDEAQISYVLFEEMATAPDREIRRIIRTLGLTEAPYDGYDYLRRNETVAIRHSGAQRLARQANRILPKGATREKLKSMYLSAFTKKKATVRENGDLGPLYAYYEPHNTALAEALSLDVSAWNAT